jgi:hypothetical protein
MFEFMKDIIEKSKKYPDGPNSFYPVSDNSIAEAERRLGRLLPPDLRSFFREVGCGFLTSPTGEPEAVVSSILNRFIGPDDVADLLLGEGELGRPDEEFDEGEFPFIELDVHLYVVLRPENGLPSAACWRFGSVLAPNLAEFIRRLMIDPQFYHNQMP